MLLKFNKLKNILSLFLMSGILCGCDTPSKGTPKQNALEYTEKKYYFGDVVFGEGENKEVQSGLNYDTSEELNRICKTTENESAITTEDFTLSFGQYAYPKEHDDSIYYPVRLGDTSGIGEITINLINYSCDTVMIYASKYETDNYASLIVNGSSPQSIIDSSFRPYKYLVSPTNSVSISNKSKIDGRVYISKIVFRVFKDK